MALKNQNDGKSWIEWEEEIRLRKPEAVEYYKKELEEECNFYEFLQYEFQEQWAKLKSYANEHGVKIIGDRKSTRLNSSHMPKSRMPSSA